jgi:hypothetical protein
MKRLVTPVVFLFAAAAFAQTPQIPTLQVCNGTKANGIATIVLSARKDAVHSGKFEIRTDGLGCDPVKGDGFPGGSLSMTFDLSDGSIADMKATTIEQMTTTGKHTPTMYLNGRCTAHAPGALSAGIPCHYWVILADNKPATATSGTPDVVGFLVVDKQGKRLNYGTGPVREGDIDVVDTAN